MDASLPHVRRWGKGNRVSRLAEKSSQERGEFIQEAAARLGAMPVIVEKDYWVCWLLGVIFRDPRWEPHLVFKGGTSLSKVFKAIRRFSEDIDLSVSPAFLGYPEADLDEAPSKSMRSKRFKQLQTACAEKVSGSFQGEMEATIRQLLGSPGRGKTWFRYEVDARTDSPVLWFDYESTLPPVGGYIVPAVKLEFGSLTDQRPNGTHAIQPMMAEELPGLETEVDDVVAMEVERTFWEKATILHAEYHRPFEPGPRPERGLDSSPSSWSERPPFGGRAIVLNSRSGGTERFLGRRLLTERQWVVTGVTTHRPRRAVWHRFGSSTMLSRLMDADERTIPMLPSDDRVAAR
jgi:hypothetical protein